MGSSQAKFLCLHLMATLHASTRVATAAYEAELENRAIQGPIKAVIDVLNESECRMKCEFDVGCTAASYDAVADVCFLTDGGPDTVTTHILLESVAFFKFNYTEPTFEVFITEEVVGTGIPRRQRETCAKGNGIPLIITTEQTKAKAIALVKEKGREISMFSKKFAWVPALDCDRTASCRWLDGTQVTGGVFTAEEIESNDGGYTLLREDGKLVASEKKAGFAPPVLCSRERH